VIENIMSADFGEFGRCDGVLRPVSRMIPAM
jgi:hypothetical protein